MPRDTGYLPALGDGLVFVGCEHNGALLALDAQTGRETWRFYTNGPLRLAPVVNGKRVYMGSDDGYLYCLDTSGRLLWKILGGPSQRRVIAHDRLISAWPITAGPLVSQGKLYFVAGYWPVDRIYVYSADATTGKILWRSDAAEFRPDRRIRLVDGKLLIDGHNSRAVLEAATGRVLQEKMPKAPPLVRPQLERLPGNLTGWKQDGRILVAGTTEGVCGYSRDQPTEQRTEGGNVTGPSPSPRQSNPIAESLLKAVPVRKGYCLVAGLTDGALVEGLLASTELHIVAVDPSAKKVDRIRRKLDSQHLFASHRLEILVGDLAGGSWPPYFADLITTEYSTNSPGRPESELLNKTILRSLRPYGGIAAVREGEQWALSRRDAAPEGAADWPQEFCNQANTLASADELVKAPLGVLWYGGLAADARFYFDGKVDHQSGHGLNPQPVPAEIVQGRMILQGPGLLAAVDIYTGRVLWERPLPKMYTFGGAGGGLGIHSKKHKRPWDYPPALEFEVQPTQRCRASGFNMVSLPEGIYIAAAKTLKRFDPATGELLSQWNSPAEDLCWGGLRASGSFLLATLFRPQDLAEAQAGHDGNGGDWAGDRMPMVQLVALNRYSGKILWSRQAQWGFLNRSGIAIGDARVYCLDLLTPKVQAKLQQAGRTFPDVPPTLYALDLTTGRQLWSFPLDVYVQNLVYSQQKDLLVVPCRNLVEWDQDRWVDRSLDVRRGKRNKNAPGKMRALQGANGRVVWEVEEAAYHTPQILLGHLLIDRWGFPYDLNTGKRHQRTSPLTGLLEPWSFRKGGCNHLVACQNLVTWRTAFYDLSRGAGVLKLSGMDAGCSPTLLPAGGVLNIPNFGTHHKRNRMTAMALIHTPENQLWTNYVTSREKPPIPQEPDWIQHGGWNFGAPGDRLSSDGTLWLQVNARQRAGLSIGPKNQTFWYQQPLGETGSAVASSGLLGASQLTIPLTHTSKTPPRQTQLYTVRLFFSEPEHTKPGQRIFSVSVEGKTVLKELDIFKQAGGADKPLVLEFAAVEVTGPLEIQLSPKQGQTLLCGVELILDDPSQDE